MAEPQGDVSQLQWAVGLVASAATASIGWLWSRLATVETRLDARVSRHEEIVRSSVNTERSTADIETRDLWAAINDDRRANAAFRERASEQLARLPTRDDLRELEARLMANFARHP